MENLARGYARAGHEVHFIVPENPDTWSRPTSAVVHQLPSVYVPFSAGYRVIHRSAAVVSALERIAPDVVEISDRLTLGVAAQWARAAGVHSTVIAHERIDGVLASFFPYLPGRALADTINRRIAAEVDVVVATTAFAAAEFDRIGVRSVRVPLGVDATQFGARTTPQIGSGRPQLVMCSRLSREKRPEFALEVLDEATRLGREWDLVIAGDGPLRRSMERRARDLPVYFRGFVSDRAELAYLLQSADAYLAPGPIETFGLAALEALACGTPVVCNNKSALPEIVGNAGYACALEPKTWVNAIERMLHPSNVDLRSLARSRAESLPWSVTVAEMLQVHGYDADAEPEALAPTRVAKAA
jgi:alpha-1,6-mannosyltransferase